MGVTMATLAERLPIPARNDDGFFLKSAIAMAFVIIAGFSLQFAMGRSSFSAPPLVHAHAIVFMGWMVIYVAQNAFVARGNIAMHRKLGWIAAGWMVLMVVLGCLVTVAMVQGGRVPFFFLPQQFLIFDPLTLFGFAGLTAAAIAKRKQTDWHRRLHFCAMTILVGPAFGRLLPAPFLIPWVFDATFAATMLFPAAGVIADLRRSGRVHPAWWWGIGANVAILIAVHLLTNSVIGDGLYAVVTAGTPGAAVAPLDFPPLPPGL
jgi:hypothetical protein